MDTIARAGTCLAGILMYLGDSFTIQNCLIFPKYCTKILQPLKIWNSPKFKDILKDPDLGMRGDGLPCCHGTKIVLKGSLGHRCPVTISRHSCTATMGHPEGSEACRVTSGLSVEGVMVHLAEGEMGGGMRPPECSLKCGLYSPASAVFIGFAGKKT